MMRIIAGKYRRLKLKTLPGDNTRPTLDRIRESFFSRIGPSFENQVVLDLFAGSGSIGFEALSREAKYVVFNDNNYRVVQLLKENAKFLKVDATQYKILKMEALKAIKYCQSQNLSFDWVYFDPPYHLLEVAELFHQLLSVLKTGALVYYEMDSKIDQEIFFGYTIKDIYEYPRTNIVVYEKQDLTNHIEFSE